jgi:putative photosynthetic complex assembly protein
MTRNGTRQRASADPSRVAALLGGGLGGVFLRRADAGGGAAGAPPRCDEPVLRIADLPEGRRVTDARDESTSRYLARHGGFVRVRCRAARERKRDGGGGDEAPFRLAAWSDGRFTLEDTVTGHAIDLQAFGRTQAETFANMLNTRGGVR